MQDRSHLSLQMLKPVIFCEVGTWVSDPSWAKLEALCLDLKPRTEKNYSGGDGSSSLQFGGAAAVATVVPSTQGQQVAGPPV